MNFLNVFPAFYIMIWDIIEFGAANKPPKCEYNLIPEFRNCNSSSTSVFPVRKYCRDIEVCRKPFHVSFVKVEPFYSHDFGSLLRNLLNACCGQCANISTKNTFKDMTQVNRSSINSSRLVFPILGRHSAKTVFGYEFLPLLDVPGGYYITEKQNEKQIVQRLVKSCRNLWPLLVIMLLLSIIAGFLIWIMETWVNKEEFPRSFFIGLFDGFWWSFISMTTVGYGDKTPKFLVSRLFSVIWILMGITICSMFTASLITELARLNSPPTPDMEGHHVGVLRHRLFDAIAVSRGGGAIYESKEADIKKGIDELIEKTKDKTISGFFLDKYTFKYEKKNHTFFEKASVSTKVQFDGDSMAYGIILKNESDHTFFKDFVDDNRDIFETCKRLEMNKVNENVGSKEIYLFSPDGEYFMPMLIGTSGAVIGVFCLGIIYEICRAQCSQRNKRNKSKREKAGKLISQ